MKLILSILLLAALCMCALAADLSPLPPAPPQASALSLLSLPAPGVVQTTCPVQIRAAWTYLAKANFTGSSVTPAGRFSKPDCCTFFGEPGCTWNCFIEGQHRCYDWYNKPSCP